MEHLSCDAGSISTHQKRQQRMTQAILGRLVGTTGSIGLVPTHGYRGTASCILQGSCQMTADRCLSRSPDGQVPHRKNRNPKSCGTSPKLPLDIHAPADPIRSRGEVRQGCECTWEWAGSFSHASEASSRSSFASSAFFVTAFFSALAICSRSLSVVPNVSRKMAR